VALLGEGENRPGWHPPGVAPKEKKIVGEFIKNSGETKSVSKKGAGWRPPGGWHPSETNKSDSEEQKGHQVFF